MNGLGDDRWRGTLADFIVPTKIIVSMNAMKRVLVVLLKRTKDKDAYVILQKAICYMLL